MKKFRTLLIVLFFTISTSVNAQIETIETIGKLVIPLVEKIFGDKASNRQKRAAKEELPAIVRTSIQDLNKDISNLERVNKVFAVSSNLFDDIGAMESLSNNFFLEDILKADRQKSNIRIAIEFKKRWNQLNDKKKAILAATKGSAANTVGKQIFTFSENIDEHLINISSTLGDVNVAKKTMKIDDAKLYVENLKEVYSSVIAIKTNAKNMNNVLISYIASLSESFKNLERSVAENKEKNKE